MTIPAEYKTPQQIISCGKYPFSMGQLRFFLSARSSNGLDTAVRKVGKRIYLRVDLFNEWIEAHDESVLFG
jgi:hypothetical protein